MPRQRWCDAASSVSIVGDMLDHQSCRSYLRNSAGCSRWQQYATAAYVRVNSSCCAELTGLASGLRSCKQAGNDCRPPCDRPHATEATARSKLPKRPLSGRKRTSQGDRCAEKRAWTSVFRTLPRAMPPRRPPKYGHLEFPSGQPSV